MDGCSELCPHHPHPSPGSGCPWAAPAELALRAWSCLECRAHLSLWDKRLRGALGCPGSPGEEPDPYPSQ